MNLLNKAKVSIVVDYYSICKFQKQDDERFRYIKKTLISIIMPLLELDNLLQAFKNCKNFLMFIFIEMSYINFLFNKNN